MLLAIILPLEWPWSPEGPTLWQAPESACIAGQSNSRFSAQNIMQLMSRSIGNLWTIKVYVYLSLLYVVRDSNGVVQVGQLHTHRGSQPRLLPQICNIWFCFCFFNMKYRTLGITHHGLQS